jgi:hypothetical protein
VLSSIRESWLQAEEGQNRDRSHDRKSVEALLKYGAYDMFREAQSGVEEEESRKFIETDIDEILAGAKKVAHSENSQASTPQAKKFSLQSFGCCHTGRWTLLPRKFCGVFRRRH